MMWTMPGGDRRYAGFEEFSRRCAFLYTAGAAAMVVAYPFDVAFTCLAADHAAPRRYRGIFHFYRCTMRDHGPLALYRGFPLCLSSALPFVIISTGVHDLLAPVLLRRMGQQPVVDPKATQPGDPFWLVRSGAPAHLYPWNLLVGAFS